MAVGLALAGINMIGTAVSAVAGYSAGQSAKATAQFNAHMMELEAKDTIDRGEQASAEIERQGRGMVGEQRATLAAQGIDVNDGTAAQLQADTVRTTLDTVRRTRTDAAMQAWGLRINAKSVRRAGAMAARAATFGAAGGIIAGGAQSAAMGYKAYREG